MKNKVIQTTKLIINVAIEILLEFGPLFLVIGILTALIYIMVNIPTTETLCEKTCAPDPVSQCFKNRAVCVGPEQLYVKSFKSK